MDLNYLHRAMSACRLSEQTHTPHAIGVALERAFCSSTEGEKAVSCNILFAIKRPALLFLGARVQKAKSGALTASSGTHTHTSPLHYYIQKVCCDHYAIYLPYAEKAAFQNAISKIQWHVLQVNSIYWNV
jgi:hypothetical protein